jgi:hypothetical protein
MGERLPGRLGGQRVRGQADGPARGADRRVRHPPADRSQTNRPAPRPNSGGRAASGAPRRSTAMQASQPAGQRFAERSPSTANLGRQITDEPVRATAQLGWENDFRTDSAVSGYAGKPAGRRSAGPARSGSGTDARLLGAERILRDLSVRVGRVTRWQRRPHDTSAASPASAATEDSARQRRSGRAAAAVAEGHGRTAHR